MQHGPKKKKKKSQAMTNTFPVSGNGLADLTIMEVSVLCCLTETTLVWTELPILAICLFLQILFGSRVIRKKPGSRCGI